jgi:hypothetical protein
VAINGLFTIVLPVGEFYDPIVDRFVVDRATKSLLNSYSEAGRFVNLPGKAGRYAEPRVSLDRGPPGPLFKSIQ